MKKKLIFCTAIFGLLTAWAVPEYLVTGKSPSRLEKLAEKELKYFYRKIYQRELKNISPGEAAGKSVIYLGNTTSARQAGFDFSKAGKEEWFLKTVNDDLIISGGRPAGTLYGVYELLERLGTAFVAPGEILLPEGKPAFPAFNEKRQPSFAGRLLWDGTPTVYHITGADAATKEAYRLWILRNRINGRQTPRLPSVYMGDFHNITTYPYHNLDVYVPPQKYFNTHPEYFRMDEFGRRVAPKKVHQYGAVCMSNPEVQRVTLESLRGFIRHDRKTLPREEWPVIYDISELDATHYICRCPECKKIIAVNQSESDLLMTYINFIARQIRKEYPEIMIRTSARRRMPGKIRPEKNVLIDLDNSCHTISPFVPLDLKRYPAYSAFFRSWVGIVSQVQMWDYWNLGGEAYHTPPRLETIVDTIQPDLKLFHKNKVVSMFIEAGIDRVSPQNFMMLHYFIGNHLMTDINADVEKLIDQFFKGYYGPAAGTMRKYFDKVRAGVKKYPQPKATSIIVDHWKYLTPEFMWAFYSNLKQAASQLPADSRFARRVRHELISPIWYTLVKWPMYEAKFTASGVSRKQLIRECRQYAREYIRRYPARNTGEMEKAFEKRFVTSVNLFPRPEKFKNIPDKDFRILTHQNFRTVSRYNAFVVPDKESLTGYALKSAYEEKGFHGVDVVFPGVHKFVSTFFEFRCSPGKISTTLRQLPRDEKYHWYRIPGSVVLSEQNLFWGHGWTVQARADHWYTLTNGDPKDNTWDQIWFSAKFTGPAYVPGSKKQNAIYVNMLAAVRNSPDPDFIRIRDYTLDKKNWSAGNNPGKSGTDTLEVIRKNKQILVAGPVKKCSPEDVVILKLRSPGMKKIGCRFYDSRGKFIVTSFLPVPDTGYQNEYVFKLPDVKKKNIGGFQIVLPVPEGRGKMTFSQMQVWQASRLNIPEK